MYRILTFILLCVLAGAGCNSRLLLSPPVATAVETRNFVMITPAPGDTFTTLADTYLGDGEKAWRISAFNEIEAPQPGQRIVIPLNPLNPNGIHQDGYQVVPILLYASITTRPSKSRSVHAGEFDRQMQYLNENGFATVSLDQFNGFLTEGDELPPLSVIVSFDSSRRWVYEIAYPILKKHGMKAALFVRPGNIGAKGRVTWSELAEMAADVMDIGLYGPTIKTPARENIKVYFDALDLALTAPKKTFRKRLKQPCRYFAYPTGKANDLTIAMLKKHGYRIAFTRNRGSNPFFLDNYKIKRSSIFGFHDMDQFRKNLTTFRAVELK